MTMFKMVCTFFWNCYGNTLFETLYFLYTYKYPILKKYILYFNKIVITHYLKKIKSDANNY